MTYFRGEAPLVGLLLAAALLLSSACVYAIPDYKWRSKGELPSIKPTVFLRLGNAPQVCAGKNGLAVIEVLVDLINLPPQEVKFVFNEKVAVRMFGKNIQLTLNRVKVGQHSVVVSTAGYHEVSLSWSVWDCGGVY